MGTFEYRPFAMQARDNGTKDWGSTGHYPATDAQIIAAALSTTGFNIFHWSNDNTLGSASLTFDGRFYLDGSLTPLTLNDLPAGFVIDTCLLTVRSPGQWATAAADYDWFVSFANELNAPVPAVAAVAATITPATVPDAVAVSGFIKFSLTRVAVVSVGVWTYDGLIVSGTYHIFAFTYNIPLNGTDIDLQKNRLITITSPGGVSGLNLAHVTITLGTCPITIITQTATLLIFSIPDSCSGDGLVSIIATGDGTQFSGSVPLGSLTILLTNASGIYTLVPGKANDTLYSSERDGTTYNVKIPNPTAKTGFIGG